MGLKNHQDFCKTQCFNELPPGLKNPGSFHLQFALGCMFALPCSQFAVHYPDRRSSLRMFVMEFIRNLYSRLCTSAWGDKAEEPGQG